MSDKKHIEVSAELYDAIQQLKKIFSDMGGQKVEQDEDVLSILVSGFIDSVMHEQEGGEEGHEGHDHAGHDHAHADHAHHHHAHGKACACGDEGCKNEDCECKK